MNKDVEEKVEAIFEQLRSGKPFDGMAASALEQTFLTAPVTAWEFGQFVLSQMDTNLSLVGAIIAVAGNDPDARTTHLKDALAQARSNGEMIRKLLVRVAATVPELVEGPSPERPE